ncbi:MAG: hypothetical protein NTZ20_04820 [Candidatus Levybacteria bacterium]|nr:hypothetical protein [Candidatus Levybacteria bacterium]
MGIVKSFKPMLAYEGSIEVFEKLIKSDGSLYVSPKLDGIRAVITENGCMSRSLKPIRNISVQNKYNDKKYIGLDGELITGKFQSPDVFNKTSSNVMSIDKTEYTKFYVFDNFSLPNANYSDRIAISRDIIRGNLDIEIVKYYEIKSVDELLHHEIEFLNLGYEGIMVRRNLSPYKFGRSTEREGGLGKFKRFITSEAKIVGIEPLFRNENESFKNELNMMARSSSKENLVQLETMGALHIVDMNNGMPCKLGTGFTEKDRQWFWDNKNDLDKLIIQYKYFPIGMKNAQRIPSYIGIRDIDDL